MQASPLQDSGLRCGAFNLTAALDAYEVASGRLVETWLDAELYAELARQIEAIREHGMSVPRLNVLALQLVIAHAELVSTMWQDCSVGVPPDRMKEMRLRHAIAVEALRLGAARVARSE